MLFTRAHALSTGDPAAWVHPWMPCQLHLKQSESGLENRCALPAFSCWKSAWVSAGLRRHVL